MKKSKMKWAYSKLWKQQVDRNGTNYIGSLSVAFGGQNHERQVGMHPWILFLFFCTLVFTGLTVSAQQKIGVFDGHTDVGVNVKQGSATYIPETGQYIISGAGYNVWGDHDEFQFVWKKMKGDFILYA